MRYLALPFLLLALLLHNLPLALELAGHKIGQRISLVWVVMLVVLYLGMVYKNLYRSIFSAESFFSTSPARPNVQLITLQHMLESQPTYMPALLLLHQLNPAETEYLQQATQLDPRLANQTYQQSLLNTWVANPD